MPMHDVAELYDYWEENPPTHWLLKWYVGYKPKPKMEEDPVEAMRMMNRSTTSKKIADAPASVRRMIESVKALTSGR